MKDKRHAAIESLLQTVAPGAALLAAVRRREAWLPPFLADADTIPAGPAPYHSGSVLAHTARCMDAVAGDALAVWMALGHDAGKLTTPRALWPHHYGHESRGRRLVAVWARHLGLSDKYTRAGILAARLHMKAGRYARLRPGKKFDLLHEVAASGFFVAFWKVVDADTKSSISETAWRDWQQIRTIPNDTRMEEKTRQKGIALLKLA
ncbi:hypothetical protein [Desulfovibrio sp. ZJ369]|uniref:hypothetical protein n=1 Tax=Desulfovibrio sp. ZJ369 TaxID=2709793 RepID=UPI0013EC5EF8|nr:hypothetical protein [Desulfovibrio sp. ZJ369]